MSNRFTSAERCSGALAVQSCIPRETGPMRKILLMSAVVVIMAWCGYLFWATYYSPFCSWTERGQFGDVFGALNALFTGLALAAISVSVWTHNQSRANDKRETQRRMVLELLQEWHSARVHHARSEVNRLTKQMKEINSLSEYDLKLSHLDGLGQTDGRDREIESIRSIFTILYYWERVALMQANQDVDEDDLRHYLGGPAKGYMPLVRMMLSRESSPGGHKNADWVALLDRISKLFQSVFEKPATR